MQWAQSSKIKDLHFLIFICIRVLMVKWMFSRFINSQRCRTLVDFTWCDANLHPQGWFKCSLPGILNCQSPLPHLPAPEHPGWERAGDQGGGSTPAKVVFSQQKKYLWIHVIPVTNRLCWQQHCERRRRCGCSVSTRVMRESRPSCAAPAVKANLMDLTDNQSKREKKTSPQKNT